MTTMKKNIITTVIGSLVATSLFAAIPQASAFERPIKGEREENKSGGNAFIRLDTNQDSVLSLDELLTVKLSKVEKRFTAKDTDESGSLSFEEFAAQSGDKPDLSVIAAEIVQCVADIKADSGNENIIVPDEDKFKSTADKFASLDISTDDEVSLAEIEAHITDKVTTSFTQMDTDESGDISEEEFKTSKQTHRETRKAIKQCIDELTTDEVV